MRIAIASDHRGYELKQKLIEYLKTDNEILDLGTHSEESVDFPEYGIKLGEAIMHKEADFGIAICGTGIGISIAANKVKGIMCAKISNKEEAKLAKEHNNTNVIAMSGRISIEDAITMVNEYMNSSANEEEKYVRRINQILKYDNEH